MLGLVFTELIEMVEDHFSPELADAVLLDAGLSHGGAYTAVGYYSHDELLRLVQALSVRSGLPVDALVQVFGKHLLGRFTQLYPQFFERAPTLLDLLASIDGHIHVEVRKLYGEATLPTFSVLTRDARHMVLRYASPRGLHELARGLILGAADFYGQACSVQITPGPGGALIELELAA